MEKNMYCVIMAGGVGSRFWPLSRKGTPKQFIDILGVGKTLIRQTFDRFRIICPVENFLIVTNSIYKEKVMEEIPELKESQILLEPLRRNTAPCITYANYRILKENPDATVVVAPSDHLILKEKEFLKVIKKGLRFVEKNNALLTLGIKPHRPDTGYGYIQVNKDVKVEDDKDINKVKTFTEKPDRELAKFFVESGEFYWNSGLFLWSLKSIMQATKSLLPEVNSLFREGLPVYGTNEEEAFIEKTYTKCRNISIDYGIMEKAENVFVLCSDFGWSDLGTWGSLYDHTPKDASMNSVRGKNVILYDTNKCIINVPDDKLIVVQGLDDFIVVESEGVLLICRKADEQHIRQIVNDVKINKGDRYI